MVLWYCCNYMGPDIYSRGQQTCAPCVPYIDDRAHRGADDACTFLVDGRVIFAQRNANVPPTRSYRKWIHTKEGPSNL